TGAADRRGKRDLRIRRAARDGPHLAREPLRSARDERAERRDRIPAAGQGRRGPGFVEPPVRRVAPIPDAQPRPGAGLPLSPPREVPQAARSSRLPVALGRARQLPFLVVLSRGRNHLEAPAQGARPVKATLLERVARMSQTARTVREQAHAMGMKATHYLLLREEARRAGFAIPVERTVHRGKASPKFAA